MKTLIIGKNSFFATKFKVLKNSKSISHKAFKKEKLLNYDKIILLSMPNFYKTKISKIKFEKEIFQKIKDKKIIYFSTSLVYPNKLNNKENDIRPQNFYAKNKIKVENEIKKNFENFLIIRAPIVFNKKKFSKNSFFDTLNKNFKKNLIKFNIDFKSRRDLITLDDLFRYYQKMDKINLVGTFNIGSKKGFSVKEIVNEYFGKRLKNKKINYYFNKKVTHLTLSVKKIEKIFPNCGQKIYKNALRELKK